MTQSSITDLETLKERLQRLLTQYCNDPVLQGCAAALEELTALRRPVEQRADPAWDVRRAFVAEENAVALNARVEELEAELTTLRRPMEQSAEVEAARTRDSKAPSSWFDGRARTDAEYCMRDRRILLSALDAAQRELSAVRAVANKQGDGDLAELGRLRAEIARLSSPPPERADIAERQTAYREQLIASDSLSSVSAEAAVRDIDTLLQDLARARNALDDRVRMLGIVQDSLSERNRQNVELRAKCERLEADNKRLCDVDSENAGLEYGLDEADIECAELRQRIERLEGALRETLRKWVTLAESGDAGEWDPEKEPHVIASRAALTASQHTAGSPPSPTGPVYEVPSDETFVILCDDQEEKPEFFQGPNAEAGARFRLATRSVSWHAHLFKRVATTARDSIGTSGSGDGVAESAEGKHECMQCGKKFSTLQHWSFHQDVCDDLRPDQRPCGDGVAGD